MDFHYEVKRITDYGEYTAVVAVSRITKKTTITLFEGTFQMNADGVTPIKSGYNEKSKQNLKQFQQKKA